MKGMKREKGGREDEDKEGGRGKDREMKAPGKG